MLDNDDDNNNNHRHRDIVSTSVNYNNIALFMITGPSHLACK